MNGGPPFGEGALHWAKNAPGFNLDRVRHPFYFSPRKGPFIIRVGALLWFAQTQQAC